MSKEQQERAMEVIESMDNSFVTPYNNPTSSEWFPINKDEMPYGGIFYPKGWQFWVRRAYSKEILDWSSMDENDPFSVLDAFAKILTSCIRIKDENGRPINSGNILELDRLFFLLYIRDVTLPDAEDRLKYTHKCTNSSCGEEYSFSLFHNNLEFEDLSEFISEKGDIDAKGRIVINTKSFGKIHYKIITINEENEFKKWLTKHPKQQKEKYFSEMLPILMNKYDGMNLKNITSMHSDYMDLGSDLKKLSVYQKVIEEASKIKPKSTIKVICPSCGQEDTVEITFPNGFKSFFHVQNINSEFL